MKIGLIAAAFAVCATAASAQTLTVNGEDGVTYTVIEVTNGAANGQDKDITTRRSGDGATLYAKHAVSCDPYRAGLMGTGATLDAMNDGLNSNPEMAEIIRFSAEDVIAGYACEN